MLERNAEFDRDVDSGGVEADRPGIDRYEQDLHRNGVERHARHEEAQRATIDRANRNSNRPDYAERSDRAGPRRRSLREEIQKNWDAASRRDEQREHRLRQSHERAEERQAEERQAGADRPKPTVRDAITDAIEQANLKEPGEAERPGEQAATGRETAGLEAETAQTASQGVPDDRAAREWLADHWEKIPADTRKAIAERVNQVNAWGAPFAQLVEQHKDAFAQAGVRHPVEGLHALMGWHELLRRDPAVFLPRLAANFGINIPITDAAVQARAQQWDQYFAQQQQVQQAQQEAAANQHVAQWAGTRPQLTAELRRRMHDHLIQAAQLASTGNRSLIAPLLDAAGNVDLDALHDRVSGQAETNEAVEAFLVRKSDAGQARKRMAELLSQAEKNGTADQFMGPAGVDLQKLYLAATGGRQRPVQGPARPGRKPGRTVRESIMAAVEELRA
jgi:hypothetical protein